MRKRPVRGTVLEFDGPIYYSLHDESVFFEWINKIGCVVEVSGRGSVLRVVVNKSKLSGDDLREFLALFKRYGLPMVQLAKLRRKQFDAWFHDSQSYWWHDVFPDGKTKA